MQVSVVTPTIRKDGLDIVQKALSKQTFSDFEWLIGSKFDPEIPEAIWVKDTFEGGFWTLNRMYNELFRQAKGELIITLQDWIWINPDGIEKFVIAAQDYPGSVITGVGDQYETQVKWGKPEICIWADPRKTTKYGSFYECFPQDAEWNWCCIPRHLLVGVGGMDEHLDFLGYGGDQLQTSARLDACKVKFYIDQTNESFTVRHDRSDFGGQEAWDKAHVLFNGRYEERLRELMSKGLWPKLDYLA
jgi:hypothetical protein